MLMYFFRFVFLIFLIFLPSLLGKDIRVFIEVIMSSPYLWASFHPPICVLTLQNFINKHIANLENEKLKMNKINLQDVKLRQTRCQIFSFQQPTTYRRSIMVMGGASWRGGSWKVTRPTTITRLKMENAYNPYNVLKIFYKEK
jgi:hypothetical protein